MISVSEAKKRIAENTILLEPVWVPLYDATGFILAEDLYSPVDMPSFDQSAMDGYGIRFDDLKERKALIISGEIPAGVFPTSTLLQHTAVRIFTGAPVPEGCDTVIMQENVRVQNGHLLINDSKVEKGLNIRKRGSQSLKGSLALKAGSRISPGAAGFLAGLGFDTISVFRPPKVCIINTGKELMKPGQILEPGKVYESNSYSLMAALAEMNIGSVKAWMADDDEVEISNLIKRNLPECDVMVVSGGVSVGDYDFVTKAFDNCGVQCIFHKVKQKPGKPIYFGKYKNTLVFGLPGNPAAALTCFYEYLKPALKKLMGFDRIGEAKMELPLGASFNKKEGLTYFIKGRIAHNEVFPLPSQESYLMNSFAIADCIIQLDENETEFKKGDQVEVHLLNN